MAAPLPVITVQAQFTPGVWSDITAFMRNFSINRPSSRQQGPLLAFQAGTCSVLLDNSDGRFDPDNLAGPYTTSTGLQIISQVFSSSGTWTAPANLVGTVKAECCGGGGGGAGADNLTGHGAAGGGGGEYAAEATAGVTAGVTYTVTVGAGGAPGAFNGNNPGSAGGNTVVTLDSVTVTAHGGGGGRASGLAGLAGTGSTNGTHFDGGAGGGNPSFGTANYVNGAGGGSSAGPVAAGNAGASITPNTISAGGAPPSADAGPGGMGGKANQAGHTPPSGPGGGGGGGWGNTSGSRAGGAGYGGQVRLTYAIPVPAATSTQVLPMVDVQILATWPANTLGGDASTFDTGNGGWFATANCTIAHTGAQAHTGAGSLAVTSSAAGNMDFSSELFQPFGGGYVNHAARVVPGATVTMSAWARAAVSARSVVLQMTWLNADGTQLSAVTGANTITDSASAWTQITTVFTAPAGARWGLGQARVTGTGAAGEVHYIDDVIVTPTIPLLTSFADSWTETAADYNAGYGEVTLAATDAFKVLAGITLPALVSPVGAGEDTGARISRVLNSAGWPAGARNIDSGDSGLQATSYGDSALNLCQLAADSEIGQLYTDGAGNVTFRHRQAVTSDPRSATPQAVFGDLPGTVQAAGTELAYAGVSRANDDTTLASDVQATIVGGSLQEVTSLTSIAQFGFTRTYARSDLILLTDLDAAAWAGYVLYTGRSGENRFETLTIDPLADTANLWPQVLSRDIGDRIQIWRRAPGVTAPVVKNCFITGIAHTFDAVTGAWQTQWTLASADKYGSFFVLDDPVLGRLDYSALGW